MTFEAHKINKLIPLNSDIIVADMQFTERLTAGGIVLPSDDGKNSGIRPRWGRVYAVGPKQTDVKVGEYALVAHGRWTKGIKIDDGDGVKTIRKVDPDDVMMVSDVPVQDDTMSDKTV
tara:strand:+ start:1588 stop:1941 length:354 start_codon:yes stop_codon:yes gene_type:complete